MKFMVTAKVRPSAAPGAEVLKAVLATLAQLKKEMAEGVVEAFYQGVPDTAYAVVNAASPGELGLRLNTHPVSPYVEWHVQPVMTLEETIAHDTALAGGRS